MAILQIAQAHTQIHLKELLIKEATYLIVSQSDKEDADLDEALYTIVKNHASINRKETLQFINKIISTKYKVLAFYEIIKRQTPFDLEFVQSIFKQILNAIDSEQDKVCKIEAFCDLIENAKIINGNFLSIDKNFLKK